MDKSKYVLYFHDGTIIDIQQIGDALSISMESCELSVDELDEDIVLSDAHTFKGKRHLKKLNSILMNNKPMFTPLIEQALAETKSIHSLIPKDKICKFLS
jgi:hypothetical protein